MEAEKTCATCGRRFAWRRKWARSWDAVRYCSSRCRNERPGPLDRELEAAIIDLLQDRPQRATICPSEAARAVQSDAWRPLLERTRRAARRLVEAGSVVILQDGRPVDPATARGPIRIGRPR